MGKKFNGKNKFSKEVCFSRTTIYRSYVKNHCVEISPVKPKSRVYRRTGVRYISRKIND
jgi:hypothetical protein